ncbi:hypothetical protein EON79_23730 [bacterium]|nr:MAG: hypothetical protein EON79_23730 [bacterium]
MAVAFVARLGGGGRCRLGLGRLFAAVLDRLPLRVLLGAALHGFGTGRIVGSREAGGGHIVGASRILVVGAATRDGSKSE